MMRATVEVEEQVCSFEPADNGAGPLWCHGSTVVARHGNEVYVAGLETLADQQPLNNCRWVLYRRGAEGKGCPQSPSSSPSPACVEMGGIPGADQRGKRGNQQRDCL